MPPQAARSPASEVFSTAERIFTAFIAAASAGESYKANLKISHSRLSLSAILYPFFNVTFLFTQLEKIVSQNKIRKQNYYGRK